MDLSLVRDEAMTRLDFDRALPSAFRRQYDDYGYLSKAKPFAESSDFRLSHL